MSRAKANATIIATVELFPMIFEPALIGSGVIVGNGQVPLLDGRGYLDQFMSEKDTEHRQGWHLPGRTTG